jgi:hypothetical protein
VIPASPTRCHQGLEHLAHRRRGRQRHPVLTARFERDPQVLAVELDLAARIEVVFQDLVPFSSITLLAARPPERTSRIFSGATPPFEPRTSASSTASMARATTICRSGRTIQHLRAGGVRKTLYSANLWQVVPKMVHLPDSHMGELDHHKTVVLPDSFLLALL